jgi:hypothetical protein
MIHHRPSGDVTHVSRRSHRRTSCTTVDYQDQVQITYASELYLSGMDLISIQETLGHYAGDRVPRTRLEVAM